MYTAEGLFIYEFLCRNFCLRFGSFFSPQKKEKAGSIEPFFSDKSVLHSCRQQLFIISLHPVCCVTMTTNNRTQEWTYNLKNLTRRMTCLPNFRDMSWSLSASVLISTVRCLPSVFCPVLPNYLHVSTPASHCPPSPPRLLNPLLFPSQPNLAFLQESSTLLVFSSGVLDYTLGFTAWIVDLILSAVFGGLYLSGLIQVTKRNFPNWL